MKKAYFLLIISAIIAAVSGCSEEINVSESLPLLPEIYPDYCNVTVPGTIAPLNFTFTGVEKCALKVEGKTFFPDKNNNFTFKRAVWKKWMQGNAVRMTLVAEKDGVWAAYEPFEITVSPDPIDPYISYRLIPPGYQGWMKMGLYQRDLESYRQTPIIENRLTGENCLNCHTPWQRNPEHTVFHARADFGGTFIINENEIEKLNTKTDSTVSALVYPYWHPDGRFIAFSTNVTKQSFFNHGPDRIEVFDSASDIVVYDTETHSISWSPLTKSEEMFETFPTFSPDGKWLYFCSSAAVEHMPADYDKARYGIYRIAFNADDGTFGDSLECVYDAAAEGMSASFPRISPDGRWLAFTRHSHGNFSIWHKDADIWMIDLTSGEARELEINSDEVDSYHTWSGNGRWMVFSSRRDDGLYTRPYICHIGSDGHADKPFMLPQKNPKEYYRDLMYSYNIPEFMTGRVTMPMRRISSTMRNDPGIQVTVAR